MKLHATLGPRLPASTPRREPEGKEHAAPEDAEESAVVRIHASGTGGGDVIREVAWTEDRSRLQLSSSRYYRREHDQPEQVRLQARLELLERRLAAVNAQLARLRATPVRRGHALVQGTRMGAQAAAREFVPQLAGQATLLALTRALDTWSGSGPAGRWAAPLAAGSVSLAANLYFGRRSAQVLATGGLIPATSLASRAVLGLPIALDGLALVVAGSTGGHAAASALAIRTLGSRTASVVSALLSQVQAGAWGTVSPVAADGQPASPRRILRDMEPRRITLLAGLHSLASVAILVFMADWLAQQLGGSDASQETAKALCNVLLELLLAFVSALIFACSAARAGLDLNDREGRPHLVLDNLRHPGATWDRARSQAGIRIWMRAVTTTLPGLLRTTAEAAGASAQAGAISEAKVNGLMALRGWVAERPATLQALARERQGEALDLGLDRVQAELAAEPQNTQHLRLVYGLRGDDQFAVVVVPGAPPGDGKA